MSPKQVKIALSFGGLIIFVLLFIAPKVGKSKKQEVSMASKSASNINLNSNLDLYLKMANGSLDPTLKTSTENLLKLSATDVNYYDTLAAFWDKQKRPDLASYFFEKKATQTLLAKDWFVAGNRYYYSIQFTNDETERPILFQSAIRAFKSGLKLDPSNLDSKIMLATCFVEGTDAPMEGITLLKEVEKIDSNNVKLQVTFAFFSVKSGQTDKAISRFNKVLQIDSNYIEAYLHLADIYEQRNETEKTIEVLKKYAGKTTDPTAKLEIEKYIKQLK